jgi:hypothetical protein
MPTYKQRPHSKKQAESLPFYRPIDRLAFQVMRHRKKLAPFLIAVALVLGLLGAFKIYAAHYEDKASALLNRGELEALAKDYGRSKAAKIARVKLGKLSLDAKEYDRAIDWYAPVASDSSAPALLRIGAQQNLALAHLKKEDAAKAVEILRNAAKDPENASADYTELLLARTQEVGGHKDKALEIYRALAEGAKEPAVKLEAQERRKWLESSH